MNISIIGSGNMATSIATRMVSGGHTLTIYDRKPEQAESLVGKLGSGSAKELGQPIEDEIVIIAAPYTGILDITEKHGEILAGKIIVDISNPIDFGTFELLPPKDTSGAEEIAKKLPAGTHVLKAFNTTFAGTLTAGTVDGKEIDVFIAGDDAEAKQKLKEAVGACGLRCLDAGPLSHAKHLEGFQLVHMSLQSALGTNWMSAIKILS